MGSASDIESVVEHLRKVLADGRVDDALAMIASLLAQLREKNTELELRLAKVLRREFGRSSEKIDPAQLALLLSEIAKPAPPVPEPVAPALPAPEGDLPKPTLPPRKGHGRKPLPAELPREERVHTPPPDDMRCARCGGEKTACGEERSETLEFVPASFKVIVDVRLKCACRPCGDGVVIAPPAEKPIDKGLPGPGLVAHVLTSKYKDHLPLHRLSGIYARSGVDLAVSTLAGWVAGGTDALAPIAKRIGEHALASHMLQTDDTGLLVLDEDHPAGAKRGHAWVYVGDAKWCAFVYTPNWKKEGPQSFLAKRRGWLQTDGYKGYEDLFTREGATAIAVGCWAHARRGFVEALDAGDSRAAFAVDLIAKLYAIERAATEAGVDHDERRRRRQEGAPALLDQLGRWLADIINGEPPKSALYKAAYYVVARWDALRRFLEDGRVPLDNNASERRLREIAVGRKNYLFAGSDAGAERAVIAYTVIGTCILAGLDPWAYLKDVLEKLAAGWQHRRLDELLPPNWAAARAASAA